MFILFKFHSLYIKIPVHQNVHQKNKNVRLKKDRQLNVKTIRKNFAHQIASNINK